MGPNGHGRIQLPGAVQIGMMLNDGPNAQPLSMVMQDPSGAKIVAFGGLSKIEAAAIQIAAGLLKFYDFGDLCNAPSLQSHFGRQAAALASAVLTECRVRAAMPDEPAGQRPTIADNPTGTILD